MCLYIPPQLENRIQSVEVSFGPEQSPHQLDKHGQIWTNRIDITPANIEEEITYRYVLKYKYNFLPLSYKKSYENHQRKCLVGTQKDIISREENYAEDSINGIIAHLEYDFKQNSTCDFQTAFRDFDNLVIRNIKKFSLLNEAFKRFLSNDITEEMCLLVLHAYRKKYLTKIDEEIASKIKKRLQSANLDIKKPSRGFAQFAPELLQIYKCSHRSGYFMMHFMAEMHSLLDVSAMRNILLLESAIDVCNCSHPSQCLEHFLKSVLDKDTDLKTLNDIICLIFCKLPKREVLQGLGVLEKLLNPNTEIKKQDDVRNHVFQKMTKYLSGNIQSFKLTFLKDFFSKGEDDIKNRYISHCQKEIVSMIANPEFHDYIVFRDLQDLCQHNSFFQDPNERLLLLIALLKTSWVKSRHFVRYIITGGFKTTLSEKAKISLEETFDEFLKTEKTMECLVICHVLFGTECYKGTQKNFLEKFHASNMQTEILFNLNSEVENLNKDTIDFYVKLLKERLQSESLDKLCIYIEKTGRDIDSR